MTVIPIIVGTLKTVPKGGLEELVMRKNLNNPDDSIVEIGQNTEKSSGDLRRFTVTQTPVENH